MENNGPKKFKAMGTTDEAGTDESKGDSAKLSGVFEALENFGMSSERVLKLRKSIEDLGVREGVQKAAEYFSEQLSDARDYAKNNKEKVIGGAAGVLVGASLLAMAIRRASGDTKAAARGGKKSAAKRASGAASAKKIAPAKSKTAAKKSAGSSTASTRKSKPAKAAKSSKLANAPGSKRGTSKSSPRRGR